jgi:hypothetical protein
MPGILATGVALAVILPGTAAVIAPASPAVAAAVQHSARHRPVPPPVVNGGVDSIASFFLSLASNPASNFLMDKLGIPTTSSQVAELAAKLDAIQRQLAAFQAQVTALITQLSLTTAVTTANHSIEGLATFYRDHFTVIGADLVNLKRAQEATPPNPAAVKTAMDQYNTDKKSFITAADALNINGRIEAIHKAFEPGSGATGLMRAVGESLLVKKQFLTRTDSDNERSIYTYYEENQALAAWMTCEWEIARGHSELVPVVVKEFNDAVAVQRNPDTPNGLPPLLPQQTVLDRGSDVAKATDSRHKLLFTSTRVNDAAWAPPGHGTGVQAPAVVSQYNTDRWQGFADWMVPSQGEVYGLFGELDQPRDRTRIAAYLTRLNLDFGSLGPFIWTRDSVIRDISIDSHHHESEAFRVFEGISTSDLRADERPRLAGNYVDTIDVYNAFNSARGTVLLVRNTGETRYF